MTQPLGVTPDYTLRQQLAHAIEFFYPNSVLETRQGRLRSQVATLDSDRDPEAVCESDPRSGGPNRWRPGSRRRFENTRCATNSRNE
jgi:hypothetical protein